MMPVSLTKTDEHVCGLSESSLAERRIQGLPPGFLKLGSRVFYRQSALDAYLASCRRRSASDDGGVV